jgi:hypothetical protein
VGSGRATGRRHHNWIVDAERRSIEAHSDPSGDGYSTIARHEADAALEVPGFEDVCVPVASLFG